MNNLDFYKFNIDEFEITLHREELSQSAEDDNKRLAIYIDKISDIGKRTQFKEEQ